MSLHDFANDLAHLEYVVPLLERGNPLSLPYWRNRVTGLPDSTLASHGRPPPHTRRLQKVTVAKAVLSAVWPEREASDARAPRTVRTADCTGTARSRISSPFLLRFPTLQKSYRSLWKVQ
jgi:hypothetical protein